MSSANPAAVTRGDCSAHSMPTAGPATASGPFDAEVLTALQAECEVRGFKRAASGPSAGGLLACCHFLLATGNRFQIRPLLRKLIGIDQLASNAPFT